MLFHTFDYLVFFCVVFALYWCLPRKGQQALLLAAGYFFYGYVHPWYCILLGATTLVDFTFTRLMEDRPGRKKAWLLCILISNFTILATFKYFGFFTDNVLALLHSIGWDAPRPMFEMLLPAGVSFYTFQSCSYAVDVYRGQTRARRSLLDYAVYVSFFPQLVAGPIERAGHLLPQFEKRRQFDFAEARDALFLILWGLVKKRVIADTAAVYANKVFSLDDPSFPLVWAGALIFAIQIYADFSAYTDIARGSARLLGFELMQNFHHPYVATSPQDFWRRWHISLSTWFRDYVYIPLGGARKPPLRASVNLFLTFLLSGLWHGAAWNFILWGAWHGAALIAWKQLDQRFPAFFHSIHAAPRFLRWLATMLIVLTGWLMFREHSIQQFIRHLTCSPFSAPASDWLVALYLCLLNLIYALPLIVHAAFESRLARWPSSRDTLPGILLQIVFASLLFCMLLTLSSSVGSDFIYFQF